MKSTSHLNAKENILIVMPVIALLSLVAYFMSRRMKSRIFIFSFINDMSKICIEGFSVI
jgi:hypothetical protein